MTQRTTTAREITLPEVRAWGEGAQSATFTAYSDRRNGPAGGGCGALEQAIALMTPVVWPTGMAALFAVATNNNRTSRGGEGAPTQGSRKL